VNRLSDGAGIENILLENISMVDSPMHPSRVVALKKHPIRNVTFRGLSILGQSINNAALGHFTVQNTECEWR